MNSRVVSKIQQLVDLTDLIRLPLSLMVAGTAISGALATRGPVSGLSLWALGWGVFLLAAASSVLNQVLERVSDRWLSRTRLRPLATGKLAPGPGSAIGLILGSGGLAVLLAGVGMVPTLLGLAALAWYLAIYTPLKRCTPLAVLAGTPCGAIPPLMGWLSAGGSVTAPQPLALALFMILWQVPHYWLLALPTRIELRAAGFRVLPDFSNRQLLTVSVRWVWGLSLCTLLLTALDMPANLALQGIVFGLAVSLAAGAAWIRRTTVFAELASMRLRHILHLYLALILLSLLIDRLLATPI